MTVFLLGFVILIVGYFVYGKIMAKIFGVDEQRAVPSQRHYDGVDYVPLSTPRNALIQLLNIAGTGPVFGPILGALFGPVAFIIIPIGNIFAGAVHDFMIGMISVRNKGSHIPELSGRFLGRPMRYVVNIFAVLLLLLLGTVFVRTPADLFVKALGGNSLLYGGLIFVFYIFSTILPINKFIARIYPYLGGLLLISCVGIFIGILTKYRNDIPSFTFENLHPSKLPLFPMFFMTVTCGLLSGFHATQSPIISRTLRNEKYGRKIFYGMMVTEGCIAMVWAAAGMIVFNKTGIFNIGELGGPAGVVTFISTDLFGSVIGIIMVLGVIVLPITSGDTSFRSLRMIIADYFNLKQDKVSSRFMIAIPLFVIAGVLFFVDFNILWRYFSWANQTTGTIALFIASAYLIINKKPAWIAFIPAIFMLGVTTSFLGHAKFGFNLSWNNSYVFAAVVTVVLVVAFLIRTIKVRNEGKIPTEESYKKIEEASGETVSLATSTTK